MIDLEEIEARVDTEMETCSLKVALYCLLEYTRELEAAIRWRDVREELPPLLMQGETEDDIPCISSRECEVWAFGRVLIAYLCSYDNDSPSG